MGARRFQREGALTTARGMALAGVEEGMRGYLASMAVVALLYHSPGATSCDPEGCMKK